MPNGKLSGGWTLMDAGSVEEAENRFAAAFQDGALLEVRYVSWSSW